MDRFSEALRKRLKALSAIGSQAESTAEQIHEAAGKRLEMVNGEIEKLRPRVNLSDEAAQRYQDLVLERGHLQKVMSR